MRIMIDVVWGLILGWAVYSVAWRLVPRLEGPLALGLIAAGTVVAVLVRYPGAGRRTFLRDVNDLVPAALVKVAMAWLASVALLAVLVIVLQGWDIVLPEWTIRLILLIAFGVWFIPDVRRWVRHRSLT